MLTREELAQERAASLRRQAAADPEHVPAPRTGLRREFRVMSRALRQALEHDEYLPPSQVCLGHER